MKTLSRAIDIIKDWSEGGCVGSIVLFSGPKHNGVDLIGEQTIKLDEFDTETRNVIHRLFDLVDAWKIELFRDKDGNPDRVKVVRRF